MFSSIFSEANSPKAIIIISFFSPKASERFSSGILFFILWIDFYLDAWIVTNERIINISQKGFFNRDISELKLTKIQDVTSEIVGVIPTILGYGNIYVQTAAEVERFTFYQIPNPNEVKNTIVQLQEKERKSEEVEMGQAIRGEL